MQSPVGRESRRRLSLDGACNVRDVGGYRTTAGGTTRWRTLLRAGNLDQLSAGAQVDLGNYGVRTVVDLRRKEEVRASTWLDATKIVRYIRIPFGEQSLTAGLASPHLEPETVVDLYRAALQQRQEPIRATLACLAKPGTLPAVVLCAAGRDRTGLAIALTLGAVGVPAATIAADYALEAPCSGASSVQPGLRAVIPAPEIMLRTLTWVDQTYGSVGAYLRSIGLSAAEMAALRAALAT